MLNQWIFAKRASILGTLLILSLGAFFIANVTTEVTPIELVEFSTYFGGMGDEHMDVAYAFGSMVVDSKGCIIVAGRTTSTDFPTKVPYQDHLNGYSDSTISKFYSNGTLIFSTFFGGSEHELITGVAVDSNDNIVVAGNTGSSDFPVVNPIQENNTGVSGDVTDCFIAKFSEDGQSLLFSTYYGGTSNDYLYAMAIDSNDQIVITGTTQSTDFPLLNPVQDSNNGFLDIFVSLFEADCQSILFSTYLGTTGIDHGRDVKFDSEGNLWLTGIAAVGDLATEGAYQEEYAGGISDTFLAKFNTSGNLEYLTFLGGAALEWGNALAIDSGNNVIITGFTTSDDFPTMNSYQNERVNFADVFITKFTPDGHDLLFSTYFGGSLVDYGNAITIDSHDNIVVTGQTTSDDFPTTLPYNTSDAYHTNVTLLVLDSDGALISSMAFGGSHHDVGIEIVWHSEYRFFILGYSESADFPVCNALQATYGGESDMFITNIDLERLITTTTTTPTSTSTLTNGFSLGLVEGGITLGIIVVVVVLLFIRRRT